MKQFGLRVAHGASGIPSANATLPFSPRPALRRAALALALICLICARATIAAAQAEGALKPGEILNQTNWQKAEKMLPPEVLKHYKNGEYANEIIEWGPDTFPWPKDFVEGSKANEGKYVLGQLGEILEKSSGKQPPFVFGLPFPTVDPKDPQAGTKILWNHYYAYWYFGNFRVASQMTLVNATALDRRMDLLMNYLYYDAVSERERPPNPQNFATQQLVLVTSPADVNGTAALTWRYRDPTKRDNTWSYVPALRRVRAVSPSNRSDGFLGSDMSQDDGPFFDGKVEDFTWTFKGEIEGLRFIDPIGARRKNIPAVPIAGGGWHIDWPDIKTIGYQDPNWKGVAWAPISFGLVQRPLWIIEGVPKDKYYQFGRIELHIDKETYQGAWNRKFAWNGELLNTMQISRSVPEASKRPDGGVDYNQAAAMGFQCVENIKRNQSTVAGVKSSPTSEFDFRIPYDPQFFDTASLSRFGK